MKYCFHYVNDKPTISETACVQNYCCGIVLQYCVQDGVITLKNEIRLGDGMTECYTEPEPTLVGCPDGSYLSTRCFNSCLYGE